MKIHKLKYIRRESTESVHHLAIRLLSSYSKCPKCSFPKVNKCARRRYKRYIAGLFSVDMIGARMTCDKCSSEWWEESSIENTFKFNPLTGMICLWFFLIFNTAVAIAKLIKLMNMIEIPVEIRNAEFNHEFNNELGLECLAIFIICAASFSIYAITSNKNKHEDGRK